jgi:O-antigen ligase
VSDRNPQQRYTRTVAIVTMALYTLGHATIGFPLFLLGTVWRLMTRRPPLWHRTAVDLPLAVFALVIVLSAASSAHVRLASTAAALTVVPAVVVFGSFAWLVYRDPGVRLLLLRVWAIGAVPAALLGTITGAVEHDRAQIPGRGGMGPNALGTTLLLGSLCALGLAYRSRGRERTLWFVCCLVTGIGLLATESRSSFAGWLVAAGCLAWREFHDRPRRLLVAAAAGFAALVLATAVVPTIGVRTHRALEDLQEDRLRIWQTSLRILKAYPILGTGRGTYSVVFDQWKPPGSENKWSAHNLWLTFAVETGLLGFVSVLWLILTVFRESGRLGRGASLDADPVRTVGTAMWIGLLVDQCGDSTLLVISIGFGFWLLMALLVVPVPTRRDGTETARISPLETRSGSTHL